MTETTATIEKYGEEMQVKRQDGRDDLYRYRCGFCGRTGRWNKNGNMANVGLRAHQGDSRERTPCPRLR